jgi:dethiobiotin synthetase
MAAEDEERQIDFFKLIAFCKKQKESDYLLIEGPGGVMTPVDKTHTVLDWMAELGYEVILITGSYLGAISHALTAYQAIAAREIPMHSLIINASAISPVPVERILLTLKHFLPNNLPVHCVARQDQTQTLKRIVL